MILPHNWFKRLPATLSHHAQGSQSYIQPSGRLTRPCGARTCTMTVVAEATFLDTNILVYASVDASPFHTAALSAIAALEQNHVPLWISRQVIRQYLATLV